MTAVMEHPEQRPTEPPPRPAWTLTADQALTELDQVHDTLTRLSARRLELLAHLDQLGHARTLGARDTVELVSLRHRLDPQQIRRDLKTALALPRHPIVATQLPGYPACADASSPDDHASVDASIADQTGEVDDTVDEVGNAQAEPVDQLAALIDRQCRAQAREVRLNPAQVAVITETLEKVPTHVPAADLAIAQAELVIAARTLLPRDLRRLGRAVLDRLDTDGPAPADDAEPVDESTPDAAQSAQTLWYVPGTSTSPTGSARRVKGLRFGGFLTAENAELFQTLIDAAAKPRKTTEGELDPRTVGQRRADAFAIVLRAAAATGGEIPSHGGIKPHLSVTIPFSTLSALPTFHAPGTATTESPLALPTNHGRLPIATDAPSRLAMPTGTSIPTDLSIPLGLESTNLASTAIDLNMRPPATASVGANSATDSGVSPRGATAIAATIGLGSGSGGGGLVFSDPLSVSEVRRIACDAGVIPIVLGAQGEPLDVGREQRLVTPAMRRALIARDGGCVIPGCGAPPGHCDAHHLIHWADGGITAVTNLALVCTPHHRAIHRGVWTVTIVDGQVHISRPGWTEPGPSG